MTARPGPWGLAGVVWMAASAALAQGTSGSTESKTEPPPEPTQTVHDVLSKRAQVDLSVPPSPAFAVLGLTPTAIERPGTVREFASALTRGFDRNGQVKTGLAIDMAPLPLLAQERVVGGERYKQSPLTQVLTRTTVSLATADSDGGKQLAWGIRVGLIDRGDPGLFANELAACVRKLNKPLGDLKGGRTVEGPTEAEAKATSDALAKCNPKTNYALWAKPALYVGYGRSWYAGSGKLRDSTPAASALWATYSVGREWAKTRALLQLHGERKTNDRIADAADASRLLRQDSRGLVARLKLSGEKWHGYADLGRHRVALQGSPTANTRYRGIGAELRLRDDLWLQVGRSSERGFADGSTVNRVTAGIRFGDTPLLEDAGPAK